jgi:restriction system protein
MPIPDFESLMLPVLRGFDDGTEHRLSDVRQHVGDQLKLSDDERAQRLPSGSESIFSNRLRWAIQYLKWAGALKTLKWAVYQITDRGRSILKENPAGITAKTLRQFREFTESLQGGSASGPTALSTAITDTQQMPSEAIATPEASLDENFQILREALVNDLVDAFKTVTPAAFENIVVDLLKAMYGGPTEDAGMVVGKSGDGGIDGVIKQDELGLDEIYVQAKRWKDAVGSPEIMKFSGGLAKKQASRGVFITASTFTKDALDYVKGLTQKIVLVDGKQLAILMVDHNVGVTPKTYTLKRLNQDYFDNL